ncbi:dienelactone hydrolase family protein [Streptomyces sp. NPDC051104]|uniref:dienelactone hydrolase family protein n=1 Tax=Streptomyces sp. NPDC051104 TaxID=3155044 RepID=UPI0034247DD2
MISRHPGRVAGLLRAQGRSARHYGELDTTVPLESLEQLRAAIEQQADIVPTFHLYPAGHAFFNDGRETYHAASAQLAWDRTLEFLNSHVG